MDLFKDYVTAEDIPTNAMPLKLMFKPTEMGKLAIIVDSPDWKQGDPPIQINFDIRRLYTT